MQTCTVVKETVQTINDNHQKVGASIINMAFANSYAVAV